jgi:hypothetical protein
MAGLYGKNWAVTASADAFLEIASKLCHAGTSQSGMLPFGLRQVYQDGRPQRSINAIGTFLNCLSR